MKNLPTQPAQSTSTDPVQPTSSSSTSAENAKKSLFLRIVRRLFTVDALLFCVALFMAYRAFGPQPASNAYPLDFSHVTDPATVATYDAKFEEQIAYYDIGRYSYVRFWHTDGSELATEGPLSKFAGLTTLVSDEGDVAFIGYWVENVVDDVPHVNISNMPNAGMETKILVIDDYIAPPEWWGCRIVGLNLQDQPLTVGDTTVDQVWFILENAEGERCYKHKESPCWYWDGENYILASATVTINFDNSDTQSLPSQISTSGPARGLFPCCAQTSVENIIT